MAGKKTAKPTGPERYLIRTDGKVFNYTKRLAARGDMKLHKGPKPDEKALRAAAVETETGDGESGEAAFDIGKATKRQLVEFAKAEYGLELDAKADLPLLRKLVQDAAKKAADAETGSGE